MAAATAPQMGPVAGEASGAAATGPNGLSPKDTQPLRASVDDEGPHLVLPVPQPSFPSPYAPASEPMPFQGGFRHAATGAVFHHAATQTAQAADQRRRPPPGERVSMGTQTGRQHARAVQCPHDAGTQCPTPGGAHEHEGTVVELTGVRSLWMSAGTA